MTSPTQSAKRFFETAFDVEVARGESVETALGEDETLHVHVVKVLPAQIGITVPVTFTFRGEGE